MDFSILKTLSIPDGIVKKLESSGVILWEEPYSYTNQVFISTDENGDIYNGVGYKNGYRIRSGGAESEAGSSCCTGFIPCKAGDILRFCFASGTKIWTESTAYYTSLNFSDESFTNLGQFTSQPAVYDIFASTSEYNNVQKDENNENVWKYIVTDNSDIAFVRFAVPYVSDNDWIGGADLIVTVNEEINQLIIE